MRDKKTGLIIEEKQGDYTVSRTYDRDGNCTHITSCLGADIRHTYNKEGALTAMQAGENWQASWIRDNTGLELQRTLSGGVSIVTERDRFGREVNKMVRSGKAEKGKYRYLWGVADRLLSKENQLTGAVSRYDYDEFDFLIREDYVQGAQTDTIYRVPDRIGNLFETPDKKDRKYSAGGRLEEDPGHYYHYDDEGNLIYKELKQLREGVVNYNRKEEDKELNIRFRGTGTGWRYDWLAGGMLKNVKRPDEKIVLFTYDALGRRISKFFYGKMTRWVWDGNVPLHEWEYKVDGQPRSVEELPPEDVTTWVFEAGSFVPAVKLTKDKLFSIVTDYLGTPVQMFDERGEKNWECELDVYGKVRYFTGSSIGDCPFRYQGQYEDKETGLYYNRFRYYSPNEGIYISQDPIGLVGGFNLYGYVEDSNEVIDTFGLSKSMAGKAQARAIAKAKKTRKLPISQQPTVVSAAVSRKTGRVYYGES